MLDHGCYCTPVNLYAFVPAVIMLGIAVVGVVEGAPSLVGVGELFGAIFAAAGMLGE